MFDRIWMAAMDWVDYIVAWEAAEWGRCYEAAEKDGYSADEAEECDEGSLNCSDCPWGLLAEE